MCTEGMVGTDMSMTEHGASEQPGRHGLGIGDGAWGKHGAGGVYGQGLGRDRSGCEATEWESETSMRCMVGHGARGTRRVVMTAGDRGAGV